MVLQFAIRGLAVITNWATLLALLLTPGPTNALSIYEKETFAGIPHCQNDREHKAIGPNLLYVTTLDGTLTALDMTDAGKVHWQILTQGGPLVSSSPNLPFAYKGRFGRLIPTLSGGIYIQDPDSFNIGRIPITVDHLLNTSSKFLENVVMSGGKETLTYGISIRTGQLSYECSMHGCSNTTYDDLDNFIDEHDSLYDDVLILRRQTKIVYAVEPRTGVESWNFSVAYHELDVSPAATCASVQSADDLDLQIKFDMPRGIVCAIQKSDMNTIVWKHQFTHPIVAAWRMSAEKELNPIDLFNSENWLDDAQENKSAELYLGKFKGQFYIQESTAIEKYIANMNENVQFPWRPIWFQSEPRLHSTDGVQSLESDELNNNKQQMMLYGADNTPALYAESAAAVGLGAFLYSSKSLQQQNNARCDKNSTLAIEAADSAGIPLKGQMNSTFDAFSSIYYICFSIFVGGFAILLYLFKWFRSLELYNTTEGVPFDLKSTIFVDRSEEAADVFFLESENSSNPNSSAIADNYTSRFQTDFELVRKLGRGGFGTVFEVKNKLDQYSYAVKRIKLSNNEESRERVLREVRILAKCEHKNIVRYFQSWIEEPPIGWRNLDEERLESFDNEESFEESTSLTESLAENKLKTFGSNSLAAVKLPSSWLSTDDSWTGSKASIENALRNHYDKRPVVDYDNDNDDDDEDDDDSYIVFQNSTETLELQNESNQTEASATAEPFDEFPTCSEIISSEKLTDIKHSRIVYSGACQLESARLVDKNSKERKKLKERPSRDILLFIQMQLCRKESLQHWLQENDIAKRAEHISHIFHQIVDGVEYVHSKGLIHRDLKPQNIFFSQNGEVKIGDFGLVTGIPQDYPVSSKSNRKTQQAHTEEVGTEFYMSPEVKQKRSYNNKVDIYSLGLILFEMHVYFTTAMERFITLSAIKKGEYPENFRMAYPAEHELLCKMLNEEPEVRPDAAALKQQLNLILPLPQSIARDRNEAEAVEAAALKLSRSRTFSSCD